MAKKSRSGSQKSTPVATPSGTPRGTPTKKNKTKSKAKAAPKKQVPSLTAVPRERIARSIEQLRKFEEGKEKTESQNLLEDDEELNELVQLIVVNNASFTGSNKAFKVKLATVKHSLYSAWNAASETSIKDFKVLLIVKDADINKISADDLIREGEERQVPVEIISGRHLKTNYKEYERRRAFLSEFSLILADDNIITTLPKLLGGKAYSKLDTTPIGVRTYANKQFSKKTLVNSFNKVYTSKIPVKLPRGTTANVHLGKLKWFSNQQFADNIELVLKEFIDNYSVRSIFIKCNNSPALPLYYNQDVLDEISSKKDQNKDSSSGGHLIDIDGVEIQLSTFDQALMEIANPDEVKNIFAKKINAAKRQREEEPESESAADTEIVKKAKN